MKMMKKKIGACLIFLGLFAGCDLERGDSAFEDQLFDVGDVGDDVEGPAPSGELGGGQGAGTMSGTWLRVHEASNCVLNLEQVSTAYYIVEIEEEGMALRERPRLCHLEMSEVLGFRPVASPAVLESIEFAEVDSGLVTRLVEGGAYSSATEVGLWGVELEDPLRDSVPPTADSQGVIDGEGDGNPGISLQLEGSGCERYMGQRQVVRYFGHFVAPNEIRGASGTRTEIVVYGASAAICQLAPDVVPNDEYSEFRMVRIDGLGGSVNADENGDGRIDCAEAARLFEEAWTMREPDNAFCAR